MVNNQLIDINCDMGESFGNYRFGNDSEIMNYVNSVNIACGFHAGDPTVIRQTVALAIKKNVNVGAHPGFNDLQGFGRRTMHLSTEEIFDSCLYQISAVKGITNALGAELVHVKPHGALYNMAAVSAEITQAIIKACLAIDSNIVFYALSGSIMAQTAKSMGIKVFEEVFADRAYLENAQLCPRSNAMAVHKTQEKIKQQVRLLKNESSVMSIENSKIKLNFDTICIHGDEPDALETAKTVFEVLNA